MDLKDIRKPKYHSLAQAAEAMGVSYHTLFRMVHNGKIKAMNVAKSGKKPIYGIRAEDIQAYYDAIDPKRKRHTDQHPEPS